MNETVSSELARDPFVQRYADDFHAWIAKGFMRYETNRSTDPVNTGVSTVSVEASDASAAFEADSATTNAA